MTAQRSENYAAHAVDVLDSVQLLRSEEIAFDFMIIVDELTFHAHRMILVACSDYYGAMFSHNTKEVQEGKVEMKGIQSHAFKQCLDFMYSGKFEVTLETAEDVLCAADILQMKKVSKLSFDYLSENLESENCIFVMKLLEIYPCETLLLKAKEHLRCNFTTVVHSDAFRQLSLADSKEYLAEYSNNDDSKWEGAVSWINYEREEREIHVVQFVELLVFEVFPSANLLKSMWEETCFMDSKECRNILFHRLFSDIADLESNITAATSFFLKKQAESYEHITKEANEVIFTFLKKNLDQVMANEEFLWLSKEDVLSLFQSEDVEYLTPESSRWNVMVQWVKANENHEDVFPELFSTIKFDLLAMEFIQNTVRREGLVKKFSECHEALIDVIATYKQALKHSIVILFFDGSLQKLDVTNRRWSKLPNVSVTKNSVKSLVCLNGNLCFLNGKRLLHLAKSNAWVEKTPMSHLPDAKAQVVTCIGSLYVIEKSAVSKYSPDQNTWTEDLPGFEFDKFTAATSENYIYAVVHDIVQPQETLPIRVKRFDPKSNMWSDFCFSPSVSYAHMLVADSRLYAMNASTMKCLDHRTGQWTVRAKCNTVSSSCTFLEVCGKVTIVGTTEDGICFTEMYDYKTDSWMKTQLAKDKPTTSSYISQRKEQQAALFETPAISQRTSGGLFGARTQPSFSGFGSTSSVFSSVPNYPIPSTPITKSNYSFDIISSCTYCENITVQLRQPSEFQL